METRDYAAIAKGYARDVAAGKIPAGKSIRLQCARFLAELKVQRRKAFPHRFDAALASRICRFIEKLPHTKGKWARSKETIRLEPWQIWILCCAFGWVRKKDGLRRFRVLFIVVPRKNGKSVIAGGIGLYMLCADREHGAEVYAGATTERQAREVFRPAQIMVKRTPALKRHFALEVLAGKIISYADESVFETIIGDPPDGQSPSCAIHDEYHEHDDDGQVDTMQTGMGARDQPMQVKITTAGFNLGGPCYAEIQDQRKRLEGIGIFDEALAALEAIGLPKGPPLDDECFFVEYAADEEDDWKAEQTLRKANPNYDVSVSGDFLKARQRDAIASPRKAGAFKTKHLDLWVAAKQAYFDIEAWRRCRDPNMPLLVDEAVALKELQGRRCILALDLASKVDIAALEYLFPPIGEKATKDDPYIRLGRYFLPEDTVADVAAYQGWDALGLLDVTPGNITDYEYIYEAIQEARRRFDVDTIAYDPFQATQLVGQLTKEGAPLLEYNHQVRNMSEPMKELDALTRAALIRHAGCPVMEWEMSNVVAQLDAKDNVYPRKPRVEDKIDNPVALISAIGVAIAKEEDEMPSSPWDDPTYNMNAEAED